MKKHLLLLTICSSFVIISCKKEYTCVCTNVPYIGTEYKTLGKQTKTAAENACKDIYKHHPSNQTISCEIK